MRTPRWNLLYAAVLLFVTASTVRAQPAAELAALLSTIQEDRVPWALEAQVTLREAGKLGGEALLRIDRPTQDAYRVAVTGAGVEAAIERTDEATRLALPKHGIAFVGEGPTVDDEGLAPRALLSRLISADSAAWPVTQTLTNMDPQTAAAMAVGLANLRSQGDRRLINPQLGIALHTNDGGLTFESRWATVAWERVEPVGEMEVNPALRVVDVDRPELEQLIGRAIHRASEVLWPGPALTTSVQHEQAVANGRVLWVEGQRVVLLWGSPEAIGRAHGTLLAQDVRRSIDSTLHLVGLVQTVRTGRWFPNELREAWARLSPHIPDDHKRETQAIAEAAGVDPDTLQLAQVFPELFHCSGFALFGSATADGKLYHGRVLDYMTHIGLQHTQAVFIVRPDGKHAFVNVGYAGFVGSVTGMNEHAVSLGEMGGRGEGDWDGVPMATLMRRALEECDTLTAVKELWRRSPRTCEYFFVWADGKTNEAVGVAATPSRIEFVEPGASHPLLGEGIPDAVLLSQKERLAALRERVQLQHGRIDVEAALRLMDRPVAMASNLHNVLFVPEYRVLYVAHADHQKKAFERPYVRLDLRELLTKMEE